MKKLKHNIQALALIGVLTVFGIVVLRNNADQIDGIKPEIPQYDAVWRGVYYKDTYTTVVRGMDMYLNGERVYYYTWPLGGNAHWYWDDDIYRMDITTKN